MRRPLCLLGLAFVAVLLLGSVLIPQEKKTAAHGIGERLTILGVVEGKERRLSQEKEVSVLSLGQIIVLKSDQAENLRQILNHSKKDRSRLSGAIPQNKLGLIVTGIGMRCALSERSR